MPLCRLLYVAMVEKSKGNCNVDGDEEQVWWLNFDASKGR